MKTQKLKQGIKYDTPKKNYIKSTMYEFEFSTDIMVLEDQKQNDGSIDQTVLHFMLREGEKAYFSEEYLPAGMKKAGVKKPDITAIIESPVSMKVNLYGFISHEPNNIYFNNLDNPNIDISYIGKEVSYKVAGIGNVIRAVNVKIV